MKHLVRVYAETRRVFLHVLDCCLDVQDWAGNGAGSGRPVLRNRDHNTLSLQAPRAAQRS